MAAFGLLLSVSNAYISPAKISLIAFGSFAFPFLWLLNLVLFFVWLVRKRWQAILLFLVLLFTYQHWINVYQWAGKEADETVQKRGVTVMSFNVRMFNYYNWIDDPKLFDQITSLIQKESPDILCIQEFFNFDSDKRYTKASILKKLGNYPYHHIEYSKVWRNGCSFGLATFSKYPIVDREVIKFEKTTNFSIQTDISVKGRTVRVFNNHLESIRFQARHLNFIDSINYKSDKERMEGIDNIVKKINTAFKVRAFQAETIGDRIEHSPLPVIVCGDFNDTPVSYVYNKMRNGLKDAFVESGKGLGGTYNGRLPSYRIDFIFHSDQFNSYSFKKYDANLSDHFPISCLIDFDSKK
jgi:endonuclease/exonuclease/phosphatase family metal-dependent hydrolase